MAIQLILILAPFMILPFAVLQFMPSGTALTVAVFALLVCYISGLQSLHDYQNDIMGMGSFALTSILISTLLGAACRVSVLIYRGKLTRDGSRHRWIAFAGIGVVLLLSQAAGLSRVCLYERRILDEDEIINRYLVGAGWWEMIPETREKALIEKRHLLSGYYRITPAKRSLLGAHRVYLHSMRRGTSVGDSYHETTVQLNACGTVVSDEQTMSYSSKEYKKWVQTNARNYSWIY